MKKLSIILPNAEKTALENLAMLDGEKMSVVIRQLLRKELRRRGLLLSEDPIGDQVSTNREIFLTKRGKK